MGLSAAAGSVTLLAGCIFVGGSQFLIPVALLRRPIIAGGQSNESTDRRQNALSRSTGGD